MFSAMTRRRVPWVLIPAAEMRRVVIRRPCWSPGGSVAGARSHADEAQVLAIELRGQLVRGGGLVHFRHLFFQIHGIAGGRRVGRVPLLALDELRGTPAAA